MRLKAGVLSLVNHGFNIIGLLLPAGIYSHKSGRSIIGQCTKYKTIKPVLIFYLLGFPLPNPANHPHKG
jgi:hypothetical protein